MDAHSSNSHPGGWVMHGSNGLKKKSSYANVVTSSRKEYAYNGPAVKCHCNKLAPRDTSWRDLNSGRRFYGCSDFRVSEKILFAKLKVKDGSNKLMNVMDSLISVQLKSLRYKSQEAQLTALTNPSRNNSW
ncbi:hypothetical protein J1N35_005682 [Gossypium stocksii]|uniref:Uncharacterized protein n=1 Tax=Gossypium stocksii TaxID=47602 RepID=A0A9D4AHB9_9ROSI|nr:hypothetical protein J1N35_005682 [Gossypium stocksii]